MATAIQLLRSAIPGFRPDPNLLADGMPMVNLHQSEPGLFFKLFDGTIGKIGPCHVGNYAPNSNPALTLGNSLGEQWFDTTDSANPVFKIWNGTKWVTAGINYGSLSPGEIPVFTPDGELQGYPDFIYVEATKTFHSTGNNVFGDNCNNYFTVNSTADFNCLTTFENFTVFNEASQHTVINVIDTLNVKGNTVLGDNLPGACADTLVVNATSTFNCPSTILADVEINADVVHVGDKNQTGDLTIDGNLNISGGFDIGDPLNPCVGTFNIYSDTIFGCDVTLNNAAKSLTVAGTSAFNNQVAVTWAGPGSALTVNGATALIGAFDVTGNSTLTGTFDVVGDSTIVGAFDVTGNSTITGTFDVTGDSTVLGTFDVTGNTSVTGNFSTTGNVVLGSDGQCATHTITASNKILSKCDILVGPIGAPTVEIDAATGDIDLEGTLSAETAVNVGTSNEIVLDGATGNITTLGGTVTAQYFAGDGSQLTNLNIPGSMTFKGSIDATADVAPAAVTGDFYLNTGNGTVLGSYTGAAGGAIVQDQFIYYTSSNTWVVSAQTAPYVTLAGAQNITGTKTFTVNQNFSADVDIAGSLTVDSDTTLGTGQADTLTVNATSTLVAPVSMSSTLDVTGNTTVGGTLGVTGATTLSDSLAVTGTTTLSSTLAVTGATTLSSTLGVTGATTLSSTLDVTGATTLSSTLEVTGATSLSSTLDVTGATTLSSTLAVTGATTLSSTLAVTGLATCSTPTTALSSGTTLVTKSFLDGLFPDFSDGDGVTFDARYVKVVGDNMTGDLTLGTTQIVLGATTGNASFAGTLGVTGAATLSSTLAVTGATTLSDTLGVTGATTLSSTLSVTGATTLSDTLGVTGAATLSSTLSVTGATTLLSTLSVTGNVSVNTDKFTVTAASGNTNVGGTLNSVGNFSVNTDKFTADTSGNVAHLGNLTINTDKFIVTAATGNTTIAGVATCNTPTVSTSAGTTLVTKSYLDTLFPDFADGEGSTLDTRFVKVVGDNMTGALTIGPAAGPAVTTLGADGSATFVGTVSVGGTPFVPNITLTASTGNGTFKGTVFVDGHLTAATTASVGSNLTVGQTAEARELSVMAPIMTGENDLAYMPVLYGQRPVKLGTTEPNPAFSFLLGRYADGPENNSSLKLLVSESGLNSPEWFWQDTGEFIVPGDILPDTDGGATLGSATNRFSNVYTQDMHFSNEGTEGNSIDGTTGNWTLQEGHDHLYFINNKTGMKFRVVMEAV